MRSWCREGIKQTWLQQLASTLSGAGEMETHHTKVVGKVEIVEYQKQMSFRQIVLTIETIVRPSVLCLD